MNKSTQLLLSSEIRLKLKLLAAIHELNMSGMASRLIQEAYETDTTLLDKKLTTKVRKLIHKWTENIGG